MHLLGGAVNAGTFAKIQVEMKSVLVIVIHPNMEESVVNKRWVAALREHPEQFVIHDLYAAYPSGVIDVAKEQALITQYDRIIFQFPYYWFNCPGLFKQWMDDVMTHGWAYGSKSGWKMQGKRVALAMSVGVDEEDYSAEGRYRYTMQQLTAPFELSFGYVKADYRPFFAFYGLEYHATEERIAKSVEDYLAFAAAI